MVPLVKGELAEDLGERGVRGLSPSELWAPGDRGDEIFELACRVRELRSKFGRVDCLNGIFDGIVGRKMGVSCHSAVREAGTSDMSGIGRGLRRRKRKKINLLERQVSNPYYSLCSSQ